jgi:hypothetical protein
MGHKGMQMTKGENKWQLYRNWVLQVAWRF